MQPVLTHPFPTRRPSELTIPVNSRVPPVTGAAVATRTNGGCVRGSVSPPLQADRASVVAPVRRRYAVRGLRVITDISQKGRCLSINGVRYEERRGGTEVVVSVHIRRSRRFKQQ